jgi:hypothetical protein
MTQIAIAPMGMRPGYLVLMDMIVVCIMHRNVTHGTCQTTFRDFMAKSMTFLAKDIQVLKWRNKSVTVPNKFVPPPNRTVVATVLMRSRTCPPRSNK